MSKIRRSGYVFLSWTGDHSPRHVHVYREGRLAGETGTDHDKSLESR